ncbi:hypothetical protein QJS04_geneDACA023342 [Acorus gramineus]|uniref:J domain-containing protein n=1 Tax=Acorus gramineus TaxID=55184 RepID=A0AAV9A6R4_ACOGR|nr:hypothetical protein QJS04_geneDACA023342 [Acorus gramineus]
MSVGSISSGGGFLAFSGGPAKQRPHQRIGTLSFRTRATFDDGGFVASEEMERRRSFYDLLGVSERGTHSEIKHAYREMARRFHPDVSPPERAEEYTKRFMLVQEAYETLSDPGRRADYDRRRVMGLHRAFSGRARFDQGLDERSEWKIQWQNQIAELRRSRMNKVAGENMSWAARIRRKNEELSED